MRVSILHHTGYDIPANRVAVWALQRYVRFVSAFHASVREEGFYQRQIRRSGKAYFACVGVLKLANKYKYSVWHELKAQKECGALFSLQLCGDVAQFYLGYNFFAVPSTRTIVILVHAI